MKFILENPNPKHLKKAGDCVIRALAIGNNDTWDNVYRELLTIAFNEKRLPNDQKVFEKFLFNHGWIKHSMPKKEDGRKYKINEYKPIMDGINIISIARHLVCVKDGEIHDLCDCQEYSMGKYWSKK